MEEPPAGTESAGLDAGVAGAGGGAIPMTPRRLVSLYVAVLFTVAAALPVGTDAGGRGGGTAARPARTPRASATPVTLPTVGPGGSPSSGPTVLPSVVPTTVPGASASAGPTPAASTTPAASATPAAPTAAPLPTPAPTVRPTPAPTPTPVPAPTASASCTLFPATNVWNKRVDTLPARADSAALVAAIGLGNSLHPDFSNAGGYGIPFNVTGAATPRYAVAFDYADESDPGPYPIHANPRIEGGSDAHLLAWDTAACVLYELYAANNGGSGWTAGSGAIWNLRSNALRPDTWTSADAAGLPILPGLVRYDEVAAGAIRHAIRFTAPYTARSYVYPARHQAGCTNNARCLPPMGLRVRLKASVNIDAFSPANRVILQALKTYGMLLADNGSSWYITGAPDARWNDDDLHLLGRILGSDFEAVDTSSLVNG